nr:phospholipase A1 [Serratia liquefaciens]
MSMPLSFTSAVSPVAAIPTPRAAAETRTAASLRHAGKSGPVASPSQNTLNAQNLLNTLVGDISAAAPTAAAAPGVTRGQQSQEGDYALALLAKDVYSLNGQGAAGFNRLSDSALLGFGIDPASLHDAGSGFQAGIYSNDKQYVLAFAGTNDWRDWLSNVRQATGYDDVQYNQAVAAAKSAKAAFGDALVIAGHSLGGGLGGHRRAGDRHRRGHLQRGRGLGLHPESPGHRSGGSEERCRSRRHSPYSEQYDMLTSTQESTSLIPDAIGHNITLANNDTLTGIDDWRPSKHLDRSLTAHGIDKVISSMAEQKPWEAKANA